MLGDPNVPGLYLLAAHDIFALLNHVLTSFNDKLCRITIPTYLLQFLFMKYIAANYLIYLMNDLYYKLGRMLKGMSIL